MANTNIINAVFGSGICAVTTSAFRANYGMVLRFSGIDLPTAFEVDFSNYDVAGRDSITAIGQNGEVQIPDDLWDSGLNIYAYVYLHPTDDSGVTVYTVTIPVLGRPNRTEETPTPHEQTVIEQAISALNEAVEQTAADVETTTANAQAAAQSEANASVSERSAAASASAALASQNAAESAQQGATESASGAAESARNAANSASAAAESATNAQESAEQAERSVQSIGDDVERAERAAATATGKATEAASSAATASTKATQAEQSATAAAQSASYASTAAQNAAESEQLAESHATDAEQAKLDAQDAQAAAEQAAESVSGLSAQITQNTADIAELVQSKAGALVDTASGSIASFYPDATVPTVRGLTVNVEPVQDLHGYDSPWPAGGGKNKVGLAYSPARAQTSSGVSINEQTDDTLKLTSNASSTYACVRLFYALSAGTYTIKFNGTSSDSYTPTVSGYNATTNALIANWGSIHTNTARTTTLSEDTIIDIRLFASLSTAVARTVTFTEFQLESGSTATAWTPYSNICPISGWDSVEVPRTGINLFDYRTVRTATTNGVTLTNNNDGTLTLNGTATADAFFDLFNTQFGAEPLAERTYTLSGCPNGGGQNSYFLYIRPNYISDYGNGKTFTQAVIGGSLYVKQGQTLNNLIFRPQIELGSSVSDFKPYQGDTYQIQLGQTVYGGTLDVTTGVLTVDRAVYDFTANDVWTKYETAGKVTFNSGDRFPVGIDTSKPCIMSNYPFIKTAYISAQPDKSFSLFSAPWLSVCDSGYSDASTFAQAMAGNRLVYYLATPITVDLTPLEISVLTGQTNNIWADSGDVSVEYAADLKTYINQKIAAAVAALS